MRSLFFSTSKSQQPSLHSSLLVYQPPHAMRERVKREREGGKREREGGKRERERERGKRER